MAKKKDKAADIALCRLLFLGGEKAKAIAVADAAGLADEDKPEGLEAWRRVLNA